MMKPDSEMPLISVMFDRKWWEIYFRQGVGSGSLHVDVDVAWCLLATCGKVTRTMCCQGNVLPGQCVTRAMCYQDSADIKTNKEKVVMCATVSQKCIVRSLFSCNITFP